MKPVSTEKIEFECRNYFVEIRSIWRFQINRILTQGTKSMKFNSGILPNRENFRLRPLFIKKSSQRLWSTMSWNLGEKSNISAFRSFSRSMKISQQGTKSMLFKSRGSFKLKVWSFRFHEKIFGGSYVKNRKNFIFRWIKINSSIWNTEIIRNPNQGTKKWLLISFCILLHQKDVFHWDWVLDSRNQAFRHGDVWFWILIGIIENNKLQFLGLSASHAKN